MLSFLAYESLDDKSDVGNTALECQLSRIWTALSAEVNGWMVADQRERAATGKAQWKCRPLPYSRIVTAWYIFGLFGIFGNDRNRPDQE